MPITATPRNFAPRARAIHRSLGSLRLALVAAFGLATAGCGASAMKATSFRFDVNAPIMARKAPVPMYVIAGPRDVPDVLLVRDGKDERNGEVQLEVRGFRRAFANALMSGFEAFYEKVSWVDGEDAVPQGTKAVIARVQVRSAAHEFSGMGFMFSTFQRTNLKWTIGLRFNGEPEYFYSFSDTSAGKSTQEHQEGLESCVRAALDTYFQQYVNKRIHQWATTGEKPEGFDRDEKTR